MIDDAHVLEGRLHSAEAGGVGASALGDRSHFLSLQQLGVALLGGFGVSGLACLPAARADAWDQVGDSGYDPVDADGARVGDSEHGSEEAEQGYFSLIA